MKIFGYWGKAQDGWHLLPYHCLDVAACCITLFDRNPRIAGSLVAMTGLPEASLRPWLGWAAALHDLGKTSPGFQWKVPEVARALGQRESSCSSDVRHDSLGWSLWHDALLGTLGLTPEQQDRLNVWMRCATGHHGIPPSRMAGGRGIRVRRYFDSEDVEAAQEWLHFADELFLPDLTAGEIESLRKASWWVAGLITLADWLGSSRQWFPYATEPQDLWAYWQDTLLRARLAVTESGLAQTSARRTFGDLFPAYQPSAIQAEVSRLPNESPFLLVIEEATGGGKTEAALAAAGGDAFFFGLPTMATANGLWARVGVLGGQQTLIHGKRWLLPKAMERAEGWVNDSSRKAILASIGVGTVDQAMLSVLQVRFGALRMAGLAGRTLIIDEVHAYDPYMTRILERLVEFHARAAGDVILLSATMPLAVRDSFLKAWARGRGLAPPQMPMRDFPLLTFADGTNAFQIPTPSYRTQQVRVERESDVSGVLDRIEMASKAGRCVAWIRNTVAEALDAFDALLDRGLEPDLFHARFAIGDRLNIEQRVLSRYGKDSTTENRRGQILVATQVVEQSLDLDFDLMVTDLAPIDLVIQRAGRLHRHARGERGPATLVIHAPPWAENPEATWIKDWSPGTAIVYPDHGRLWLTLRLIGNGFALPADSRKLIEGVYRSDASLETPVELLENSAAAERKRNTMAGQARANLIPPDMDYSADGQPAWDDEDAPTRLGPKTREWVLCTDGALLNRDIERSTVSIRANAISRGPESSAVRVGLWQKTLELTDGQAICERPDGSRIRVCYDKLRGLSWSA